MKEKDFAKQLIELIEKNKDMDARHIFGDMIELAVAGLYALTPSYPTAIAVINLATQNGLTSHMEMEGMALAIDKDKDIISTKLN